MVRRVALGCCLAVAAGLCVAAGGTEEKGDGAKISVQVKAPEVVHVGDTGGWKVTVKNEGKEAIALVKAGDGSDCGWRTPQVAWLVQLQSEFKKTPAWPEAREVARCGNINALKADEVVDLKAGESMDVGDYLYGLDFPKAGKYVVIFYYKNEPGMKWLGLPLAEHDAKAMVRVKGSTAVVGHSEAMVVEVVEKK